ncbi:MAG: phosphate signaling complex protein PhoU [Hydrogenophilales bacterium]
MNDITDNSQHTHKQFDTELEDLREKVLLMGGKVENQLNKAIQALTKADIELSDTVVEEDNSVNSLELEIDENLSSIIARRQPIAIDLRTLLAISKITTDLERIGDEASKIARMTKLIYKSEHLQFPKVTIVKSIGNLASDMLQKSLDSFARLDVKTSFSVLESDYEVNEQFQLIIRKLITFVLEDPRTISAALELLTIAKAFERIGDHSKNISEHVVYLVKGTDVRHTSIDNVRKEIQD